MIKDNDSNDIIVHFLYKRRYWLIAAYFALLIKVAGQYFFGAFGHFVTFILYHLPGDLVSYPSEEGRLDAVAFFSHSFAWLVTIIIFIYLIYIVELGITGAVQATKSAYDDRLKHYRAVSDHIRSLKEWADYKAAAEDFRSEYSAAMSEHRRFVQHIHAETVEAHKAIHELTIQTQQLNVICAALRRDLEQVPEQNRADF